jgi:hypothetical protein
VFFAGRRAAAVRAAAAGALAEAPFLPGELARVVGAREDAATLEGLLPRGLPTVEADAAQLGAATLLAAAPHLADGPMLLVAGDPAGAACALVTA